MATAQTFGAILFRRRKELRLTQSRVAGMIGVQPNYIVYLEKGERRPSDKTVRRVAEALELDKADLYLAANPQVREFLNLDSEKNWIRDNLPEGLQALAANSALRASAHITDDEIASVASMRFQGQVTRPEQYLALIMNLRFIFA